MVHCVPSNRNLTQISAQNNGLHKSDEPKDITQYNKVLVTVTFFPPFPWNSGSVLVEIRIVMTLKGLTL